MGGPDYSEKLNEQLTSESKLILSDSSLSTSSGGQYPPVHRPHLQINLRHRRPLRHANAAYGLSLKHLFLRHPRTICWLSVKP